MTTFQQMYDESWQEMLDDFRACKKPDKWKYTFVHETGEYNQVWCNKGRFYLKHRNVVKQILSVSFCAELVRKHKIKADHDPSIYIGKEDEFFERIITNYTGNHRGKHHNIKVPTAPGQPVRG